MIWLLTNVADTVLFIVGILFAVGAAWFVVCNLAVGLWRIPYVLKLRPRLAGSVVVVSVIVTALLIRLFLPAANAEAMIFGVAAIAPLVALRATAHLAWRLNEDKRGAAADVRNEIARRLDENTVDPKRSWSAFVFDVERARRHEQFEPPPI